MIISDKLRRAGEFALAVGAITGILPALLIGVGYELFGDALYEAVAAIGAAFALAAIAYLLWDCSRYYGTQRL